MTTPDTPEPTPTKEIRSVLISVHDDGWQRWDSEQEDTPKAARVLNLHPSSGGVRDALERIGDTAVLQYVSTRSSGLWMFKEWEATDA